MRSRPLAILLSVCVSLAACTRSETEFFVETVRVTGSGMAPTLVEGDCLFVNKRAFASEAPKVGDIVLLRARQLEAPGGPPLSFLMRVIAAPGDTISIRDGVVSLNGREVREPWRGGRDLEPFVVEPGRYFVSGDNRGNSRDSRYIGTVAREDILGRPAFVYFSTKLGRIGTLPK